MGRATDPRRVVPSCTTTNTSTLSVLASRGFFNKALHSVHVTHPLISLPVLEGRFVVSRCRLCRTHVMNTSTILLVTTTLRRSRYRTLASGTRRLNLRILLRVRDTSRLACVGGRASVMNVGGHGLKDFRASITGSFHLTRRLPRSVVHMSRDKLSRPRAMSRLHSTNFENFLVNRAFVHAKRPNRALGSFVSGVVAWWLLVPRRGNGRRVGRDLQRI